MVKLLIAGSRAFNDYDLMVKWLRLFGYSKSNVFNIICGEAQGADTLGKRWAKDNKIFIESFPAQWDLYGKSAGFKRNIEMCELCTHAVLFWDGQSKGTLHDIKVLKKLNKPYRIVKYNELKNTLF